MFGNNAWANPQQNQQQQQQQQQQPGTSAFGQQQPNAFGAGGTTGFGGFGQTQQQPVNPVFGGATNTNTNAAGTSGFGSFGSNTSTFGAKPSGFGFGGGATGTSAFGSGGGGFGQTNTGTTSAFGQPAAGTSAFGSTGSTGLFGQKPAAPATGFGSTSTGPTTGADAAVPPVTTGSSNPPYQPYSEKDANAPNITLNYQSISCIPAYRGTSFEELRVQDYVQGRKTAGGFGQSAAFGMAPSQSTTTAFGQPAASTGAFGFGQTNQQQSAQPTTTFGAFNQPSTSQPSAFGSGTGTNAFTTPFGQNAQQQQQQQQPQQQQPGTTNPFGGTGAFGQNAQQQQQQQPQAGATGFGFGQNTNQPKPFNAFGQPVGTGGFNTGFVQTNAQPAGQTSTSTNLFGQPANQNQGTSNIFGFGNKPAFGQPTTQPATSGFNLFGQGNQQQQQPQQPNQPQGQQPTTALFGTSTGGTNLFGQNAQQQQQQGQQPNPTQPSTGLFGQPASQPSTNLFGGGATGTNLFGGNNQNKPAFGTNLFGTNTQAAATGTTQPSTGLFGQPIGQTGTQQSMGGNAFGGTLFGQKPANTTTFGQSTSQPASTGFGNSMFSTSALGGTSGGLGQSVAGVGAQGTGTLTASVAQPVQENLPIFSLLNSSRPVSIAAPPKKTTSFFTDIPTRSGLSITAARMSNNGKLRGFGVSQSSLGLNRGKGLAGSRLYAANGPTSLAISRTDSKTLLGPESFMKSTSLGTEPRFSPKKLVLDRKIDPSEFFGRKSTAKSDSKVEFSPQMSIAAREKEAAAKPTPPSVPPPAPTRKTASTDKDASDLKEGDYYVKPPLEVLRRMSNRELSSVEGLIVGRKGYGEVQFLEPVDLTTLPRLKDLLGKLVEIMDKEVVVYPDSYVGDDEKPEPGEGINVSARVTLHGCWVQDKATGEPVKDPKHPHYIKHLKRLSIMKQTHFENYKPETGSWTFLVDHF